jgi:hypothetical protein
MYLPSFPNVDLFSAGINALCDDSGRSAHRSFFWGHTRNRKAM